MTAHVELLAAGVPTRAAADLSGVCRATAARHRAAEAEGPTPTVRAGWAPANRLSDAERAHVLAVLNGDEFVDAPPVQVYARLRGEVLKPELRLAVLVRPVTPGPRDDR